MAGAKNSIKDAENLPALATRCKASASLAGATRSRAACQRGHVRVLDPVQAPPEHRLFTDYAKTASFGDSIRRNGTSSQE